jgi:hypothetical protein
MPTEQKILHRAMQKLTPIIHPHPWSVSETTPYYFGFFDLKHNPYERNSIEPKERDRFGLQPTKLDIRIGQ